MNAADRIAVPVLIVHGRQDFTVPVAQSEMMQGALRHADKPVQAIYIDGVDHFLEDASARQVWLQTLQDFLAANLSPSRKP